MEIGCEWGLVLQIEDTVCSCFVWRRTGRRKESYKLGDPHMHLLILLHKFKYSIIHGCGTYSARYYVKLSYYLVFFTKRVIYLETYFDANYCNIHTSTTNKEKIPCTDWQNILWPKWRTTNIPPSTILMRPFLSNGPLKIPWNHSSRRNRSPIKPWIYHLSINPSDHLPM